MYYIEYGLFRTTAENYQKILDIINNNKNENGITTITTKAFMELLDRSRSWCLTHLKKINEYEPVIEKLDNNQYKANYENIYDTKLFRKLNEMFLDTRENPEIAHMKDKELIEKYNINNLVVWKYRAYVTTGCKKIAKKEDV